MNPAYTFTLPRYQMMAGFYDIISHVLEQYFSGENDNTSDYIMEGMLKSTIHSSRIVVKNFSDYEAGNNTMWIVTWALNILVPKRKTTNCIIHTIRQLIGACTNVTHGMTLSAVPMAYYRFLIPYGLAKLKRYAVNVQDMDPTGKTNEELTAEGLKQMDNYVEELGLIVSIHELGVTKEMIGDIASGTFVIDGGYRVLTHDEIVQILKENAAQKVYPKGIL